MNRALYTMYRVALWHILYVEPG